MQQSWLYTKCWQVQSPQIWNLSPKIDVHGLSRSSCIILWYVEWDSTLGRFLHTGRPTLSCLLSGCKMMAWLTVKTLMESSQVAGRRSTGLTMQICVNIYICNWRSLQWQTMYCDRAFMYHWSCLDWNVCWDAGQADGPTECELNSYQTSRICCTGYSKLSSAHQELQPIPAQAALQGVEGWHHQYRLNYRR